MLILFLLLLLFYMCKEDAFHVPVRTYQHVISFPRLCVFRSFLWFPLIMMNEIIAAWVHNNVFTTSTCLTFMTSRLPISSWGFGRCCHGAACGVTMVMGMVWCGGGGSDAFGPSNGIRRVCRSRTPLHCLSLAGGRPMWWERRPLPALLFCFSGLIISADGAVIESWIFLEEHKVFIPQCI